MKLLNKKQFAVVMLVVIIASIFVFQYINYNNANCDSQNNSDNYPLYIENLSIFEVEAAINNENLQLCKSSNIFSFNLYKTYILSNISLSANIYKLKYTVTINKVFIFCYSVFIVFFSNKKDGKKRCISNS
ncbi:MAG: hypothetical protein SA378_07910 [Sedimentibacter sp.]|nr:hypothetical protein [Sedimentibacter sp.]